MLKEKIKTLLDLIDKEKIPQEYYLDNTMNISNKEFTQLKKDLKEDESEEKLRQTKKNTLMQSQTVYSDITGFSLSNESDYGINENALDLYITSIMIITIIKTLITIITIIITTIMKIN
jgi:hypothetical protein